MFSIHKTTNTKPKMDFTSKNIRRGTKPAATSVTTNANTTGAVEAQQAFHKTKDLSDGPSYHLEDKINFNS